MATVDEQIRQKQAEIRNRAQSTVSRQELRRASPAAPGPIPPQQIQSIADGLEKRIPSTQGGQANAAAEVAKRSRAATPAQPLYQTPVGQAVAETPGRVPQSQLGATQFRLDKRFPGQPSAPGATPGPAAPSPTPKPGAPSTDRLAFERQRVEQAKAMAAAEADAAAKAAKPAAAGGTPPTTPGAAPTSATPAAAAKPSLASRASAGATNLVRGGAPVAALAAGLQSLNTTNDQYNRRIGLNPAERAPLGGVRDTISDALGLDEVQRQKFESAADFGRDITARAAGTTADIGAQLLDFPLSLVNVARGAAGAEPLETFSEILSKNDGPGDQVAAPDTSPADLASTPVAQPEEIAGTFVGKNGEQRLTASQAEEIGAKLPTGRPSIAEGLGAPRGQALPGPARSAPPSDGVSKARLRDILDPSTEAGKLYARLAGDKTPTGKRLAAQFVSDYIGAGVKEGETKAGFIAGQDASETQFNAALGKAAIDGSRPAKPTIKVTDDGVLSIADGIATKLPVIGADGKPQAASRVSKKDLQAIVDGTFATPEQIEAAEAELRRRADEDLNIERANG